MNYSTSFTGTENPLSEGGVWINGGSVGLDWSNCQKYANHATGTVITGGSSGADDATAVLAGSWQADQRCWGTLLTDSVNNIGTEVELRLNTTITANSITGYEIDCGLQSGLQGIQIVRWLGPIGSFIILPPGFVPPPAAFTTGDIIYSSNVGGLISVYLNGTLVVQATDTAYTNGSPGIGFWNSNTLGLFDTFGLKNFSASDGTGPVVGGASISILRGPHRGSRVTPPYNP